MENLKELVSIRRWLACFIIALILSGLTAFPLETELKILVQLTPYLPRYFADWITHVYVGLQQTNRVYPFLAYGTDWLAFAHIIIALVFIGPYRDPVRNIWVLQFGLLACVLVLPLALVAGAVRHIPFGWQLLDCAFGVFGFIPLYICYRKTKQMQDCLPWSFQNYKVPAADSHDNPLPTCSPQSQTSL